MRLEVLRQFIRRGKSYHFTITLPLSTAEACLKSIIAASGHGVTRLHVSLVWVQRRAIYY
eukprot:289490-Pleurochrysis_carterae.AAC.1